MTINGVNVLEMIGYLVTAVALLIAGLNALAEHNGRDWD